MRKEKKGIKKYNFLEEMGVRGESTLKQGGKKVHGVLQRIRSLVWLKPLAHGMCMDMEVGDVGVRTVFH